MDIAARAGLVSSLVGPLSSCSFAANSLAHRPVFRTGPAHDCFFADTGAQNSDSNASLFDKRDVGSFRLHPIRPPAPTISSDGTAKERIDGHNPQPRAGELFYLPTSYETHLLAHFLGKCLGFRLPLDCHAAPQVPFPTAPVKRKGGSPGPGASANRGGGSTAFWVSTRCKAPGLRRDRISFCLRSFSADHPAAYKNGATAPAQGGLRSVES